MMAQIRRVALRLLQIRSSKLQLPDSRSVAIVAPHFDDEILGCGGVIIDLLARDVDVYLVYMTDGSKSHHHLMPTIATVRADEARAVARHLRIPKDRIVMFDYEEGSLGLSLDNAVMRLASVLEDRRIDTVFGPYGKGEHLDHQLTSEIVYRAIAGNSLGISLFEYPVWAWHHWPWSPVELPSRSDLPSVGWASLCANFRIFRDVNVRASLREDARASKRQTLMIYQSQMTRLVDDSRWLTLQDVAKGRFLENFFSSDEFFHRRR